jgi:outer membrane beta-barrel protein
MAAHAQAEAELEADSPRVFSIQPRPYRLGHEFQLGLGVLPLDAFYVGMLLNGSYTYHFSDFWAWEMASIGYSLNLDTGLTEELFEDYGALPEQDGGDKISLVGTTSLVVKPLFGKLAVFNSNKVYAETFFNIGLGPMRTAVGSRGTFFFTGLLGVGLRFWWTQQFSIRFDFRDYLVFKQAVPENAMMFMFSAAFNYFTPDEPPPSGVTSAPGSVVR